MRNARALIMLAISVVVAGVAVYFASRWLSQQGNLATAKVVVAKGEIAPGTPITPDLVALADWPRASVPKGAFNDAAQVKDRVVSAGVASGEPILDSKLAQVGSKGGLSAVITPGKRALTVKVNEIIGVAGFALPGNYVDIMVNTQDERGNPISKIVLEKILVLAVAQEAERDPSKPKVVSAVTLELSPEDSERLDLARSIGSLSLVLRNQLDSNPLASDGARRNDVLAFQEPAAQPATDGSAQSTGQPKVIVKRVYVRPKSTPKPQVEKIEVIKGLTRTEVEFKE
jgi:pilus assembly protein CpaB